MTESETSYPADWRDCYFILYAQYDSSLDNKKKVTYCKPIVRAKDKDGNPLSFYGVKASMFGISLPKDTTHWSIAMLGVPNPKILFEGVLPDELQVTEVDLNETEEIALIRYKKNLKFTIGTKHSLRSKKSVSKTSNKEQIWTVEESLEILFG